MSDKLLELWEATIADSLQQNLVSSVSKLSPDTPKTDDPLVVWDQKGGPKGEPAGLADIGINQANHTIITPTMQRADDPLVAESFNKPANGLPSAQQNLQDGNTYHKENPYLQTLLFRGLSINPDTLPTEGQTSGIYEGGNLYNQGSPQHPGSILSTFAPIASKMPGTFLNSVDVFALAQWARNLAMEFGIISRPGENEGERLHGIAKGIAFAGQQFLLSTLNPADPQNGGLLNLLYAPTSLPASFIPGLRGNALSSPNTPAVLSVDGKVYSTTAAALPDALDRHLLMRQGLYVKQLNGSDVANGTIKNYPGYIGDIAQSAPQDGLGHHVALPGVDGVPISAQVDQDGLLGKFARKGNYMVNMYTQDKPYSTNPAVDNEYIEKEMGKHPELSPQQIIHKELFKDAGFALPKIPGVPSISKVGADKQYRFYFDYNKGHAVTNMQSRPDWDAAMSNQEDWFDGTLLEDQGIDDDHNYMPFTFQDLRQRTPKLLYFKAFLKDGLSEQFQPNWQSEGYYGRVDQVPTYMNTARVINVAFDVVAWHPNDLRVIWTKLHKLQSMVYPLYDSRNYLQAGPMVRMRIGDLFTASPRNGNKKGLPGYINSLTFAYDDNIWNIRKDYKVPRKISVALGFVVIHDGNPGLYQNVGSPLFGVLDYRDNPLGETSPAGIRGFIDTIRGPDPDNPTPTLPSAGTIDSNPLNK